MAFTKIQRHEGEWHIQGILSWCGWGRVVWGGVKRDETREATEQDHVMKELVCDAKELGQCLESGGRPCKVIFTFKKCCSVCKVQGRLGRVRPLPGKPVRRLLRGRTYKI